MIQTKQMIYALENTREISKTYVQGDGSAHEWHLGEMIEEPLQTESQSSRDWRLCRLTGDSVSENNI